MEKQSQAKKPRNISDSNSVKNNNTRSRAMLVASLGNLKAKGYVDKRNINKTTVWLGSTEHTFWNGHESTVFETTWITVQYGEKFSASAGMTNILAENGQWKLQQEQWPGLTLKTTF